MEKLVLYFLKRVRHSIKPPFPPKKEKEKEEEYQTYIQLENIFISKKVLLVLYFLVTMKNTCGAGFSSRLVARISCKHIKDVSFRTRKKS